jgi:hypothetical protein
MTKDVEHKKNTKIRTRNDKMTTINSKGIKKERLKNQGS